MKDNQKEQNRLDKEPLKARREASFLTISSGILLFGYHN